MFVVICSIWVLGWTGSGVGVLIMICPWHVYSPREVCISVVFVWHVFCVCGVCVLFMGVVYVVCVCDMYYVWLIAVLMFAMDIFQCEGCMIYG